MQLSFFEDIYALKDEGFGVRKSFKSSDSKKFKKLESTYSILLDETIVLYVQDNGDGTYNTFGFMHKIFNISLTEVIEIAKNKHNWCLNIGGIRS